MSQDGTVRGPGRAIIAVTLLPPTAMFFLLVWFAFQQGSLAAALDGVDLGVGTLIGVVLYVVAVFVVLTGRNPFVRRSHEQA